MRTTPEVSAPARRADRRRSRIAIGLILLAGVALRLFRLGAESLWYDETVSVYLAGSPVRELIRHTAGDIHPPGYYLLLRGWLLLTGYGDGRADPSGFGLEFASAFLSLFFGVLLIALVYRLARRLATEPAALVAAALVALSPFNVWYSQEVRMYTLGATLGIVVFAALLRMVEDDKPGPAAVAYALAAALGMYTLYYFAFLLIALNAWALAVRLGQRRSVRRILLANLAAALIYAPWAPVAFRQATQPPVPPWRTAPDLAGALVESWNALSFGQSAPAFLWPALLLTLALYVIGLGALAQRGRRGPARAAGVATATLGPLFLILLVSLFTPLYHVRYVFTYSPFFYIALAAGIVSTWRGLRRAGARPRAAGRWAAVAAAAVWIVAAGLTLRAFWFDPLYRADDHRGAVRELEAQWRPGDALVVNAGWAYTALATYWTGDIACRSRITGPLPEPRSDPALVMVTTGHTDGDPSLGWADPQSDFFAMPADVAQQQAPALFERFRRVWHYRIYDTVNDPDGLIRALLPRYGQPVDARTYPGEAYLTVESYVPRGGVAWEETKPGASYAGDLRLRFEPVDATAHAGEPVYGALTWLPRSTPSAQLATSVRLLGPDGEILSQPPDERLLGTAFPSTGWPPGVAQPQTVAIAAPEGTPPGVYAVELVLYDAATGAPLTPSPENGADATGGGLQLGTVTVVAPAQLPAARTALAEFGPVALIEASTPATVVGAGGAVPIDLLWQARGPAEELVVVAQLLNEAGAVAANLEERPLDGRYPTTAWAPGELVRDRHTLSLPQAIPPGRYRLIVGLDHAAGGGRLRARTGLVGGSDHYEIATVVAQ